MKSELECLECGASVHASCDCNVAYVPKGTRAARAVQAHPEKSDRAIAKELGVSHQTVMRARRELVHDGPVDGRIGRDGKKRRMPRPPRAGIKNVYAHGTHAQAERNAPTPRRSAVLSGALARAERAGLLVLQR